MNDPKRSARTFGIAAIDAAGRQMNRRVEIVISDERGMIGARESPPVAAIGRGPRS